MTERTTQSWMKTSNQTGKKGGENVRITVKQARIGADMTQEDMARKLGVATSTYSRWETDPTRMKIRDVVRIADITGVEVSDLKMENAR